MVSDLQFDEIGYWSEMKLENPAIIHFKKETGGYNVCP
jgi:hypothetical protein